MSKWRQGRAGVRPRVTPWAIPRTRRGRACGFLQLETGGRPLRGEQVAAVRELAPVAAAAPDEAPLPSAVRVAREVLATFGLAPPAEVERVASLLGYPVGWGRRPPR